MKSDGGPPPPAAVREATAVQVFNIPLFEVPPMLDVRSSAAFATSHIVCAVSTPSDDGLDQQRVFQRIVDHDEGWGWMLQHPLVVVFDSESRDRAHWLVSVLQAAIRQHQGAEDFSHQSAQRLLQRLGKQCRQILLLDFAAFHQTFPGCCVQGTEFASEEFFGRLGTLPRCAMLQPRLYLAPQHVELKSEVLDVLGVTHVVVNADSFDVMDGTSGGSSHARAFFGRVEDTPGVRYLKCDVPDADIAEDPELSAVLAGAARFLMNGLHPGKAGLVKLHRLARSASVALAISMLAKDLTPEQAWEELMLTGIQTDPQRVWWGPLRRLPPATPALEDSMRD